MKYLICGLGNIGPDYANTRHNIGFMVLDRLASRLSTGFDSGRHAFVSQGKFKGRNLILVKPTTFMNLSGKAYCHWLNSEKILIENSLVITDDISLPFGKIRIRPKGSNGGHNGLGNIQDMLGHSTYPRLRIGVGSDFPKGRQSEYVLSPFDPEEEAGLDELLDRCCDAVEAFTTIGLQMTMTQFNK
ncbi:aminoacyl-tRNA hydrolase [Cytophagaceae bacterium ABcell3]|nr:aminoacyl-tRNA hydrolase [Cytophagaceae bacterium ABcell3]